VKHTRTRVAAVAASTLLIPASVAAAHGRPDFAGGHGHGQPDQGVQTQGVQTQGAPETSHPHARGHVHPVAFALTGTVTAPASGALLTVNVTHGNHWARRGGFIGQDVTFDLTNAHLSVADTDGTAGADAGDFKQGDRVVIMAKLPRTTAYSQDEQPLAASHVADRSSRPGHAQGQ